MQEGRNLMSEQKRKIGFTVACVNEFANRYKMSSKEAFQYLFQFKGIAFLKENYDVEHTLDFETILDEFGNRMQKKWRCIVRLYYGSNIVIDNINLVMCKPYKGFDQRFYLTDYNVPTVLSIGRVYQTLILNVMDLYENVIEAIKKVYSSFISEEISNFNSNVYYSNPDYIKCSYEAGMLLD